MDIKMYENGLFLDIHISDEGEVFLLNLSAQELPRPPKMKWYRLIELQMAGFNQNDHHGFKHTGTQPGSLLRYSSHTIRKTQYGALITICQQYEALEVTNCLQFFDDIPIVESYTEVKNTGNASSSALEYLSSFALTGLSRGSNLARDKGAFIHIPHNTWFGECQWKAYTPNELGYHTVNEFSMKRVHLSSTGSWPCSEHLPMGCYENIDTGYTATWQIETPGSWNWEISDIGSELYMQLSGPSLQENGFYHKLKPGETFRSVLCAVAFVKGGFEESIRQLTRYRRAVRRPNNDNRHPAVIFNDYMNCLMGNPSTQKELPMIDAAAVMGCKYYCIDCGWYSDGEWWDGVGEWQPSSARFPGGIEEPLNYIRQKGMIPGLWLEIEVMGTQCPLAKKAPVDWFFQRDQVPVIDHGRYLLDFRNPEVVHHANKVVDRLVNEYGVGYIKNDYNINSGVGTEVNADSAADGLLQCTRAYLAWLDSIFERYPDLVIENCGSGGMRMEGALLRRCSIQSVTDQTDYIKMAAIACNCMTAVTPEQAAIWSYPLAEGDEEETIFNMVNAILLRIHQSGHLAELSKSRLDLVHEGIRFHLDICNQLKDGLPFWPTGLATMSSPWFCVGMDCGSIQYLAVWNIFHEEDIHIPLDKNARKVRCVYPENAKGTSQYDADAQMLTIRLMPKTARIYIFSPGKAQNADEPEGSARLCNTARRKKGKPKL
jgi:alpha-galactosidase